MPAAPDSSRALSGSRGWRENLLFRREVYLLIAGGSGAAARDQGVMTRASVGGEVQKRFSTATRTVASVDYQGRIVRRDRVLDTTADPMGRVASAWRWETHNAYADLYSLWGPVGRLNLRAGHFYQPFGLNQQTDTHGTLLQLSNHRLFGTERDWQVTLSGWLNDDLDYTVGYLLGAGPEQAWDGQAGLGVARLALNNGWLFRRGLEGGISVAVGERADAHAARRGAPVAHAASGVAQDPVVSTWRAGVDLRQRLDSAAGPVTLSAELATGQDEHDAVWSGLAQLDWLQPARRWGAALQGQHFWQHTGAGTPGYTDARASGVVTWYLRNDVGNAHLHGLALAIERGVRQTSGSEQIVALLQYYRYW